MEGEAALKAVVALPLQDRNLSPPPLIYGDDKMIKKIATAVLI